MLRNNQKLDITKSLDKSLSAFCMADFLFRLVVGRVGLTWLVRWSYSWHCHVGQDKHIVESFVTTYASFCLHLISLLGLAAKSCIMTLPIGELLKDFFPPDQYKLVTHLRTS